MIARPDAPRETADPSPGDRLFLDANVLFSAAYRPGSGLTRLWSLGVGAVLLASPFAIDEARRNLADGDARARLDALLAGVSVVPDAITKHLPDGVELPDKDRPILLAAVAAGATHLLTGDRAHFGPYFGRRVGGVLVQRPGDYLAGRA